MPTRRMYLSHTLDPVLPLDSQETMWLRRGERMGRHLSALSDTLLGPLQHLRQNWPSPVELWPVEVQRMRGGLDPAMSYAGQLRVSMLPDSAFSTQTITLAPADRDNAMAVAKSVGEFTARLRPGRQRPRRQLTGTAAASHSYRAAKAARTEGDTTIAA